MESKGSITAVLNLRANSLFIILIFDYGRVATAWTGKNYQFPTNGFDVGFTEIDFRPLARKAYRHRNKHFSKGTYLTNLVCKLRIMNVMLSWIFKFYTFYYTKYNTVLRSYFVRI